MKRFRELGVHHGGGRRSCRWNGHRDHAAAGRFVRFVYVQSRIEIVVVVNGRTVPVIVVVVRVSDRVNVECETLRLKSEEGKTREDREASAHTPSVLEAFGARQRDGKTRTSAERVP